MKKNINKKTLFFVILFGFLALPVSYVSAQVPDMVQKVQGAFVTIGYSIVVIGWVIAGILYLISAGNPEKTGIAKKALIAAVIGTVLILLAQFASVLIWDLLNSAPPAPPAAP